MEVHVSESVSLQLSLFYGDMGIATVLAVYRSPSGGLTGFRWRAFGADAISPNEHYHSWQQKHGSLS